MIMIMSEKSKQHVDSCRFCWMCHHICPIGNATGHERSTPRARALGISLVNRGAMGLEEIMDNIYECAGCGACVRDCVTGWDPVILAMIKSFVKVFECFFRTATVVIFISSQ